MAFPLRPLLLLVEVSLSSSTLCSLGLGVLALLTPCSLSFKEYISAAKLGNPFAGTYFTVQEGDATVSVAQTSSVDSTTLPQYTPTSSGSAAASSTVAASSASVSMSVGAGSLLFTAVFAVALAAL